MDVTSVLRQQLQEAHGWLEATLQGVTPAHVQWKPAGKANTIGACYAHVVLSEDAVVNTMFQNSKPLCAGTWAGRTGLSEMPPMDPTQSWYDWGRKVKVDLPALQRYAQAVYSNSDSYLATVKEADLGRKIDTPAGNQTVLWLINNVLIGHAHDFAGEISCLKGLQGLKGYPA